MVEQRHLMEKIFRVETLHGKGFFSVPFLPTYSSLLQGGAGMMTVKIPKGKC